MNANKSSYFWSDPKPFDDYRENVIYTLIALKKVLKRNSKLQSIAGDFLETYDAIAANKSESLTIWSDPTAYHWCLLASELVKANLTGAPAPFSIENYCQAIGQETAAKALIFHLDQFKLFAIASFFLAEQSYRFKTPFIPHLPLAIPGTSLYLENGDLEIYGIDSSGQLLLKLNGSQTYLELAEGATLADGLLKVGRCPVIRHKDCKIRLQPYSFNSPAFPQGRAVVEAGMVYQAEYAVVLRDALELVEQYQPQTFQQLQCFMQVVALRPLKPGGSPAFSSSDFPGTTICGGINNPYILADFLIHEFYHNRLFLIERNAPLLLDSVEDKPESNKYYSPWREDLRPLRGIIHGLYVYIQVSYFWLSIYLERKAKGELLDLTMSQIILIPLQLQIALAQLERSAQFTASGYELFEELKDKIAELKQAIAQAQLPSDVPALEFDNKGYFIPKLRKSDAQRSSVKEAILEHIQLFDTFEQVEFELQESLGLKPLANVSS